MWKIKIHPQDLQELSSTKNLGAMSQMKYLTLPNRLINWIKPAITEKEFAKSAFLDTFNAKILLSIVPFVERISF